MQNLSEEENSVKIWPLAEDYHHFNWLLFLVDTTETATFFWQSYSDLRFSSIVDTFRHAERKWVCIYENCCSLTMTDEKMIKQVKRLVYIIWDYPIQWSSKRLRLCCKGVWKEFLVRSHFVEMKNKATWYDHHSPNKSALCR